MVLPRVARSFFFLFVLFLLAAIPATAQDRLCDTSFEDCRTPLWQLIDQETVGIDVAFWFMDDTSYVPKLISKFQSGVPVRVLVDPRANVSHPINAQVLDQLAAAGIPMRKNVFPGGVLHWKMMLFVGQNKVQFSAANYGPQNFVPTTPFSNYIDEVIFFSNTTSIVNSFKTKYDDKWLDTNRFANYANINGPLTRKYPIFTKDPVLNFPPEEAFVDRAVANYNQENQKIDVIIFRNTDERHTDAFINAIGRGVPVRILNEPDTYRSTTYFKHSFNIDRMFMAGALVKNRKHLGLTHEKLTLLYGKGMAIFGSSNLTIPSSESQDEHNVFTTEQAKFQWFADQFERKWTSPDEYENFVPLPPDAPVSPSPANNALIQPTSVTLNWEGGFWAWKYDIYFGTTSNPPLIASNVNTGFPGPSTTETFTLPPLQPGTTYFWRIVGKTMANMEASSPVWSFTIAGSGSPPPAPSGLTATAANSTRIDLSWNNVSSESGYRIERSLNSSSGFQEIGSTQTDVTSFQDSGLSPNTTYFYRVLAFSAGGPSPYSNVANATTPSTPPPASGEVVLLADNYNDNSLDSSKWIKNQLITGSADASVPVNEVNQRLEVGPLFQNMSGFHFNGIVSTNAYDFTGAYNYVQIISPPSGGTTSELRMSVAGANSPAGNLYRYIIIGPTLKIQRVLGGTAINLVPPFAYNLTSMKFLRIRHDSASGNVVFETAPQSAADGNLPGAWTLRYQEPWTNWNGTSGVQLTNVRFEVRAGTSVAETNAPGTVSFDNFKVAKPSAAPTVSSVLPNSGSTSGGTAVTITGTGFASGASVQFGGVPASNVNVASGTSITATTPNHASGTVNVVVTNGDGQSGTLTNGYNFVDDDPGNESPIVTASANPTSGAAPLAVSFTASASDPDGSIVSYLWEFGDGQTSNLQSPMHTYQTPGTYPAKVTVTDNVGATASKTLNINVSGPTLSNIVLYASEAPVRTGNWVVEADATAAGGFKIRYPDAGGPRLTVPLANPTHYFEMTFTVQAGIPYRLWFRGKADANSVNNDSAWVQFSNAVDSNGQPIFQIGTTAGVMINMEETTGQGLSAWGWNDTAINGLGPLVYFPTSGTQTIRVQLREDGLAIDQLVLSPQTYLSSSPGALKNDNVILPKSN